jgi:predicted acyltransferase
MAGVAVPFALRGGPRRRSGRVFWTLLKIARRVILLFGVGIALNTFPFYTPENLNETWRPMGVLQRIGLCFGVCALLYVIGDWFYRGRYARGILTFYCVCALAVWAVCVLIVLW